MAKKGQNWIVGHILTFGLGILITIYVVVNFNNIEDFITKTSKEQQYRSTVNVVRTSIILSSYSNSSVKFSLPYQIAGKPYNVILNDGSCSVFEPCNIIVLDPETGERVSKEIFNMTQSYTISGDVISTARDFEIITAGTSITILRDT